MTSSMCVRRSNSPRTTSRARSMPVLSNEERAIIGTMYKQVSPFEATRYGAALVAQNIAHHLQTTFADKPQNWKPLVYCWRGGKRSGSMTAWLNSIGWRARRFRAATRPTSNPGAGEARGNAAVVPLPGAVRADRQRQDPLLRALADCGSQVLDLEALGRTSRFRCSARCLVSRSRAEGFLTAGCWSRCSSLTRYGRCSLRREQENRQYPATGRADARAGRRRLHPRRNEP